MYSAFLIASKKQKEQHQRPQGSQRGLISSLLFGQLFIDKLYNQSLEDAFHPVLSEFIIIRWYSRQTFRRNAGGDAINNGWQLSHAFSNVPHFAGVHAVFRQQLPPVDRSWFEGQGLRGSHGAMGASLEREQSAYSFIHSNPTRRHALCQGLSARAVSTLLSTVMRADSVQSRG